MGYILNGTGTLGKGTEPISHFLIPEVLSSTGTPALFGGQIFYNAKWTGTEYVGAFLGDASASQEEQENALREHHKIDRSTTERVSKEFPLVMDRLKDHLQRMRDDVTAPNYYLEVSQDGASHYNVLVIARDDSELPVLYYYEPHDKFTADKEFLPYGYAARRLEELLSPPLGPRVSLHYGECGVVHQGDKDSLCQTWSLWFAYLLCSGMTYEEAQQFVGKEHIDGLISFVMFLYTVRFTTVNYKGRIQFVGSLTEGTLRGKVYHIKHYIENDWRGNLAEMGLGDLVPPDEDRSNTKRYKGLRFTTTNPSRGVGRYIDRTELL